MSFSDLLRLVNRGDVRAGKALNRMARYLGSGIAMLAAGLAPDVLAVVGEVIRVWDKIRPVVTESLNRAASSYAPDHIVTTDPVTQPQMRGAMAMILQKHFNPQLIR